MIISVYNEIDLSVITEKVILEMTKFSFTLQSPICISTHVELSCIISRWLYFHNFLKFHLENKNTFDCNHGVYHTFYNYMFISYQGFPLLFVKHKEDFSSFFGLVKH